MRKYDRANLIVTRRRALGRLAAGGAALILANRPGGAYSAQYDGRMCVVRPRHIEGPYFVDGALNRSDIRSDPRTGHVKYGVALRLAFRVSQMTGTSCLPLARARIDVWHCDADGLYSDTSEWQASTIGQKFLRGYQLTDAKGYAVFTTIFPGWYPNRAVHIHFKIRAEALAGQPREFTSQIYFDDALIDAIHAQPPYAQHGARKLRNDRDLLYLFRGNRLLLPLREEKKGYSGTFDIALELS